MIHGDDDGMMMPPRIAPQQIVILPVVKNIDDDGGIVEFSQKIVDQLKKQGLRVHIDKREMRTPDKMWDSIKKGIPLRVEIGGREMENGEVTFVRRDLGRESKETVSVDSFISRAESLLDSIHDTMLERSKTFRDDHTFDGAGLSDISDFFKADKIGLVKVPVSVLEDDKLEAIMKEHALSTRCMPFEDEGQKVLIGKAY